MEFDVSRVYTAVNAEALKVGSTVICADSLAELKNAVEKDMHEATLTEIKPDDSMFRFKTISARFKGGSYALAYLVKETTEKKLGRR